MCIHYEKSVQYTVQRGGPTEALRMTQLLHGKISITSTSRGLELTAEITSRERGEYTLRFEVETPDGKRIEPVDAEVPARFYLANQLMYFTVGVPQTVRGGNTLHVYVDDQLESSRPFTVSAA